MQRELKFDSKTGLIAILAIANIVLVVMFMTSGNNDNHPHPLIRFEDDFEDKGIEWDTDSAGTWSVREDEYGNHFYCVNSKGYAKAYPHDLPMMRDFVLEIDVLINQFDGYIYLREYQQAFLAYEFEDNSIDFSREGRWLAKETGYPIVPGNWLNIGVEAIGPSFAMNIDGEIDFRIFLSKDYIVPIGTFAIGAGPDADVCFDNIKVIYSAD